LPSQYFSRLFLNLRNWNDEAWSECIGSDTGMFWFSYYSSFWTEEVPVALPVASGKLVTVTVTVTVAVLHCYRNSNCKTVTVLVPITVSVNVTVTPGVRASGGL
jgi:hypothetical protein